MSNDRASGETAPNSDASPEEREIEAERAARNLRAEIERVRAKVEAHRARSPSKTQSAAD